MKSVEIPDDSILKTHATFGSQQKNISLGKFSTKKGLVENILHVIQNDLLIPQLEVMIRPLKGHVFTIRLKTSDSLQVTFWGKKKSK